MSIPLISICIPTCNRVHLLERLLNSIRSQTFKDFEVLINDNGGDSKAEELVNNYFSDLPVSYIKNEPAVNAGANCIKVMERAKGQWIKIMHDDDEFATPAALGIFGDTALRSDKDFIFCATTQIWLGTDRAEDDFLKPEEKKMQDDSFFSLFYLNVIGHPSTVMTRRDPLVQYDSNFNWLLDIDFYIRYFIAHPGYHYLPEKIVNIGRSETQMTHQYSQKISAEIPEYLKLLFKLDPDLHLKDVYVFHRIWDLIRVFRIKTVEQLTGAGYDGVMPAKIEQIINFQKRIPRLIIKQPPWSKAIMKRYFKRIKKRISNKHGMQSL